MLNSHLAGALCNTVRKYDILFKEEHEWNMEKVLQSKTIQEFDINFTSLHFGYGNVENYYKKATLHNKLHKIKVPTLCLSAADDPFQPLDGNWLCFWEDNLHQTYFSQQFQLKQLRSPTLLRSWSLLEGAISAFWKAAGQLAKTSTCPGYLDSTF